MGPRKKSKKKHVLLGSVPCAQHTRSMPYPSLPHRIMNSTHSSGAVVQYRRRGLVVSVICYYCWHAPKYSSRGHTHATDANKITKKAAHHITAFAGNCCRLLSSNCVRWLILKYEESCTLIQLGRPSVVKPRSYNLGRRAQLQPAREGYRVHRGYNAFLETRFFFFSIITFTFQP